MLDEIFSNSITERLSANDETIRFGAVKELAGAHNPDIIPFLIEATKDSSCRVREEALKGICAFPQDVIFPKLEELIRNNENANLRNAAIESFPRYGKNATPYLLWLLKDDDEEIRMFSAQILGEIRDPAAADDLIEAIKDPDENVRHAAVESLGKIGDARAVVPLIDCLYQEFWVQYPAVIALGEIGDPSAIQSLIDVLDNEMLQQVVIEALGKIGDESVIAVFADIISKGDASVKNDIIASLVNIQKHFKAGGMCLPSIEKALDTPEMLDHLLAGINDSNLTVKKNAVIVLGWLKKKSTVAKLMELLPERNMEEYVAGALVAIGEDALPELIAKLNDSDPKIQGAAIRCIEWIGNVDGIKACLPLLHSSNDDVRSQTLMAVSAALDSEDVENELLNLLSDQSYEIQEYLIEILSRSHSKRLIEKLIKELSGEEDLRKYTSIKILGLVKDPAAFHPLQKLLEDPKDEVRAEAYKSLNAIYPEQLSADIIIKGLGDNSSAVRRAVLGCINSDLGDKVEDILFSLLNDPDSDVRLGAIEAMGRIGNESCIGTLIADFENSSRQIRLAIIRAMGNIRDKSSVQFLVKLLDDKDPNVKRIAIESLAEIRDRQTVPPLIAVLDNPDWSVRSAAIQALSKLGDQRSARYLLKKLEDPEDIIKKEAILALSSLRYREAVNNILPLVHNENLQFAVLSALERLGVPDLDFLYRFFERSNSRLKCLLVDLLGHLGDPRSLNFLLKLLKDEFFTVRCRAAKALGDLEDRRAIPILLKVQKEDPSDEVRKEVAIALKKLDISKC